MGLSSFFSPGGTKTKLTNPKQSQYLNQSLDLYGKQLGQNNVYQGNRVADFSGLQTGVLNAAPNFLSAFSNPQTAGTPLFDETGTTLKGLLSGETGAKTITPQETEKYFQASIYDPTMQSLRQDVLPSVESSYAGGNFFGSGMSKAREKAIGDTTRELNTARSDLNWNVMQNNQAIEEAKAGRAQTAVNQGIQYSQQPAQQTMNNLQIAAAQVGGLNDLFGIGSETQTQEQKQIEADIAKFAEENQITDPTNLAILLSLIGANVQTNTEQKNAGLGAGMVSSIFGGEKGLGQAISGGIQGMSK